jgi:two-component system, NtrC family, C4-dicarboxylate transport sensor histidine kinase DctB
MNWRRELGLRWLLQHVQLYLLLAAGLAMLAGSLTALAYRGADEKGVRHVLDVMAQRHAVQISHESLRGRAMGAVAMLGVNEPVLKQLVQGQLQPDAPQVIGRLLPVWWALEADAIFVLDANGRVVADVSSRPDRTGQEWLDKPFWQQAFAGRETAYPTIEGDELQRFIYLAAPIYDGAERGGNVIGVLAVKLPAQDLDLSLRQIGEHALLLSPQGMVFASSDVKWNFRLAHEVGEETLADLRQQFGPLFGQSVLPRLLPFDPARDAVDLLGHRQLRVRASLDWPDAAGRWQLVLLAAPEPQAGVATQMTLAAVVACLTFGLLYLLLRAGRNHAARQLALARSEAASREVMQLAELKARQSDLTLQLQRARELPALARTLFAELGRFLPVHQGSLYFMDMVPAGESRLCLAGSYATADAPECLALGDGLVGQCARERRGLAYRDVPSGFWRVESGLGQSLPRSLLLLPVMRSEALIGVLELASMDADCSRIESVLDGLLPVLAMNLEILLAERRLEHLLAEAREQAAAGRTDASAHEAGVPARVPPTVPPAAAE